jgi:hypothetical protein
VSLSGFLQGSTEQTAVLFLLFAVHNAAAPPPPPLSGFHLQQSCTSGTLQDFTYFTLLVFNLLFARAAGCFAKSIFLLLWNIL